MYSDEVSVVDLPQPSCSRFAEASVVNPEPIAEAELSAGNSLLHSVIELEPSVVEADLEATVVETESSPATTCTGNEELLLAESPSTSHIDDKKKASLLSNVLQCIPINEEQIVSVKYCQI